MADAQDFGKGLGRIYALEREHDVDGLVRMLDSPLELSPKKTVRAAAAAALGRLADPKAGEGLLAAASDPSEEVRYAALRALGFVRYPAAAAVLSHALHDESVDVRRAATVSLGLLELKEAIAPLREALAADDPWTRLYAAEGLATLGDSSLPGMIPRLIKSESRFALARRKRWRRLQRAARRPVDDQGS